MDPEQPTSALTAETLAQLIELPLLEPTLSEDDIAAGCAQARRLGLAAVIVRPSDIDSAVRALAGSSVVVGAAIGYPHGGSTTGAKLYEGRDALRRGARIVEFTLNFGKMISRQFPYQQTELIQMAESCTEQGAVLRVAGESTFFPADLKLIALRLAKRAGAVHYVTGTLTATAAEEATYLAQHLGYQLELKAVGVTAAVDAEALLAMRCTRLGCLDPASLLAVWRERAVQPVS